jgi:hypothetical protein
MKKSLLLLMMLAVTGLPLPAQQETKETPLMDVPEQSGVREEDGLIGEAEDQANAEPVSSEEEKKQNGAKVIQGMSILGNQEAPKSLVIVPWKSSRIGNSMDISTVLDDSRQPVDREVFMRALRYYEIVSKKEP